MGNCFKLITAIVMAACLLGGGWLFVCGMRMAQGDPFVQLLLIGYAIVPTVQILTVLEWL